MKRRTHILEAAAKLLAHYGYSKTTVADIARAVGIGVGSVYLEFDSKDGIVGTLADVGHKKVLRAMSAAADGAESASEKLTAALDARLEHFRAVCSGGPHAREVLLCPCPSANAAKERYLAAERRLIESILQDGMDANEFDLLGSAGDTADAVLLAYDVFTPPQVYELDEDPMARQRLIHGLILDGLRTR